MQTTIYARMPQEMGHQILLNCKKDNVFVWLIRESNQEGMVTIDWMARDPRYVNKPKEPNQPVYKCSIRCSMYKDKQGEIQWNVGVHGDSLVLCTKASEAYISAKENPEVLQRNLNKLFQILETKNAEYFKKDILIGPVSHQKLFDKPGFNFTGNELVEPTTEAQKSSGYVSVSYSRYDNPAPPNDIIDTPAAITYAHQKDKQPPALVTGRPINEERAKDILKPEQTKTSRNDQ